VKFLLSVRSWVVQVVISDAKFTETYTRSCSPLLTGVVVAMGLLSFSWAGITSYETFGDEVWAGNPSFLVLIASFIGLIIALGNAFYVTTALSQFFGRPEAGQLTYKVTALCAVMSIVRMFPAIATDVTFFRFAGIISAILNTIAFVAAIYQTKAMLVERSATKTVWGLVFSFALFVVSIALVVLSLIAGTQLFELLVGLREPEETPIGSALFLLFANTNTGDEAFVATSHIFAVLHQVTYAGYAGLGISVLLAIIFIVRLTLGKAGAK
jgi:hypothetical protein